MKTGIVLRLISLVMLIAAVIFVFCALSNPALGSVFYISSLRIGADIKRAFYAVYAVVMIVLFGISFFVKRKK